MNRQTRRAGRRALTRAPRAALRGVAPELGADDELGLPQRMTAALLMALKSRCNCEVCQILRESGDELIERALGYAPEEEETDEPATS